MSQVQGSVEVRLRKNKGDGHVFKFEMINRRMLTRGVRPADGAPAPQVREVVKSAVKGSNLETASNRGKTTLYGVRWCAGN